MWCCCHIETFIRKTFSSKSRTDKNSVNEEAATPICSEREHPFDEGLTLSLGWGGVEYMGYAGHNLDREIEEEAMCPIDLTDATRMALPVHEMV